MGSLAVGCSVSCVAARTMDLLGSLVDVPSVDQRRARTTSFLRGCVRVTNVRAKHGKGGI